VTANTWKLQDAKARLSEVVRRARAGEPQQVTLHGEEAVVIVDPKRFDVRPKQDAPRTMAEFVELSKKYRGADLKTPPRIKTIPHVRNAFDENDT
jgi:prevent-host-death family protein